MMIENQNNEKKRPEVTIRQMEIDDISPVYHLGEQLFTSDKYTILYRIWLQRQKRTTGSSDLYLPLPLRKKAPPGRNTDM
jgi:hypothetical protein